MITFLSPAKINLLLKVLGKRSDGYHEIVSVMQTVSLADVIQMEESNSGIQVRGSHQGFPVDSENIIFKAAQIFLNETGVRTGLKFYVHKNIPIGAGLGGGSSNAGIVLVALNRYFHDPLPADVLMDMASRIGSDVPFFLIGGTALASGRGEIIQKLRFIGKAWVLLINPGFPVSTAEVYGKLNKWLTSKIPVPNILPFQAMDGGWTSDLVRSMENDLESVVFEEYPEIFDIKEWLLEKGAVAAQVSGSGGTVFGIFLDSELCHTVNNKAKRKYPWSEVVETMDSSFLH